MPLICIGCEKPIVLLAKALETKHGTACDHDCLRRFQYDNDIIPPHPQQDWSGTCFEPEEISIKFFT